jgi:ornithine carbamoyltransferase
MRHFLNLHSQDRDTLLHLLKEAARLKGDRKQGKPAATTLKDRVVALIFEKPSLRTRVSFEAAVAQLGGSSLFLPGNEVGLGQREPLQDFARTMSGYVDALVMRVFRQATVEDVAKHSAIPVINGLSDTSHPCQGVADLLTIQELFGTVTGRTVVFVGDGNNVARSLAVGCGKVGAKFVLCCPAGYGFDQDFAAKHQKWVGGKLPDEVHDPAAAVKNADVIYTDVWTSMGQEAERDARLKVFAPYQVNEALLAKAPKHAQVMHCLPAHRGEEITDGVVEGMSSVVFKQAGNRLHAQKAVLEWLFS